MVAATMRFQVSRRSRAHQGMCLCARISIVRARLFAPSLRASQFSTRMYLHFGVASGCEYVNVCMFVRRKSKVSRKSVVISSDSASMRYYGSLIHAIRCTVLN